MAKFKLEFSLTGKEVIDTVTDNPKNAEIKKTLMETLKKSGIEIGNLKLEIHYKEPIGRKYDTKKELEITDKDRKKLETFYESISELAEDVFEKDWASKDLKTFSTEMIENDGRLGFHDEEENADEDFAIWIEPKKIEKDVYQFSLYTVGSYENLNKAKKPKPFGIVTGHIDQIKDKLAKEFLKC